MYQSKNFLDVLNPDKKKVYEQQKKKFFQEVSELVQLNNEELQQTSQFQRFMFSLQNQQFFLNNTQEELQQLIQILQKTLDFVLNDKVCRERKHILSETFKKIKLNKEITKNIKINEQQLKDIFSGTNHKDLNFFESVKYDLHLLELSKFLKIFKKRLNMVEFIYNQFEIQVNEKLQFFSDFCEIKFCDQNSLKLIQKIFTSLSFKKVLSCLNLLEKMVQNKNFSFNDYYTILFEQIFKNFINQYDKGKVQPNTFNKIIKIIVTLLNQKNDIEEEHVTNLKDNMLNYLQIFINHLKVNIKKSYQDPKLIKEFNDGVIFLMKRFYDSKNQFDSNQESFIQNFLQEYFVNIILSNKFENTYFQNLCCYYYKYQNQTLQLFITQYFQCLLDNKDISNSLILNLSDCLIECILENSDNNKQLDQIQERINQLIQKEKSQIQLKIARLNFNIFKNRLNKIQDIQEKKEKFVKYLQEITNNSHILYFNEFFDKDDQMNLQFTEEEQVKFLQDIVSQYQQDLQFGDLKKSKLFSDSKFLKKSMELIFKNNYEQFIQVLKKLDENFGKIDQNFQKNKKQQALVKIFGLFPLKSQNQNHDLYYKQTLKLVSEFLDKKNPDIYYIADYLFQRITKLASFDDSINQNFQKFMQEKLNEVKNIKDFSNIINSQEFSYLNFYIFPSSRKNQQKNQQLCQQFLYFYKDLLQNNMDHTFTPYQYQVMNQKMVYINNLDQLKKVLEYFQKQIWDYQKFYDIVDVQRKFMTNTQQEQSILKRYFEFSEINFDQTVIDLFADSQIIQHWITYNLYDLKLNLKPFFEQIFYLTSKGYLNNNDVINFYNKVLQENINQVEKQNLDNLSEMINSVSQIFTAQNLLKIQNKIDVVQNYCQCIKQLFNQEVDFQVKFELFVTMMILLFSTDFDKQNVNQIPQAQNIGFVEEFLQVFRNQHQIDLLKQNFENFLNNEITFYTDFQKKILVNLYINFLSAHQQKNLQYLRLDQCQDLKDKVFLNLKYETFVHQKDYQQIDLNINIKVIEKILNFVHEQLSVGQQQMQNFFQSFIMSQNKILQHFSIMNPLTMLLMKIISFLNRQNQLEVIDLFNKMLEKDSSYNHLKIFLFYIIYYQRQKGILIEEADKFIYNFFDFLKQEFKTKNILNFFNNQYMYIFNIYMCPDFVQKLLENLMSKNHNRYNLMLLLFYYVINENHFNNEQLKQKYTKAINSIKCSQQNSQLFLIQCIQLFLKHYLIKEQVLEIEDKKEDFNFEIILNFLDKIDTNTSTMDDYFSIIQYFDNNVITEHNFKVLLKILSNFKKYFQKQPDQRQSYQLIQKFQNISLYLKCELEENYLQNVSQWMKESDKLAEKLFCQTLVLNCNLKTFQDIKFLDQYQKLMQNFDNQNKVQIYDQFESNVQKIFSLKSTSSFQDLLQKLKSDHFKSEQFNIHVLKGTLQSLQYTDIKTIKDYFDYCDYILAEQKDDQKHLLLKIISQYQYLTNNQEIMQYQNKSMNFQNFVEQIYKYKSNMQYFS